MTRPAAQSAGQRPGRPGGAPRRWSARHAGALEIAYHGLLRALLLLGPVLGRRAGGRTEAVFAAAERRLKGAMFGCRMCGTCVLSATGMSCPMTCPKNLRNGPCGGVREGGYCEVEPAMPCVWLDAWDGARRMRNGRQIHATQEPLDHRLEGRSTWLAVATGRHHRGAEPVSGPRAKAAAGKATTGGTPARGGSRLARALQSGRFCVTAEFNPPDTADAADIVAEARPLAAACDAVNVTDGAGANTHISSVAVCALLAREGMEPVMQLSCRDRNRIALQSEALGAAALGIGNIICLTGDGVGGGDQPDAKPVFDLDCTSLLSILRGMRDSGQFRSGRAIAVAPRFHLGATSNPCGLPPEVEVDRLEKKIDAGAQFIQSQFCFDLAAFRAFHEAFVGRGLHERCRYLVGVGPLRSAKAATWMRNHIAGLRIPDALIGRLDRAADPAEEGVAICTETIEALRGMDGLAGVHIMAFRKAETVGEIVARAGLLPRAAAGRPAAEGGRS